MEKGVSNTEQKEHFFPLGYNMFEDLSIFMLLVAFLQLHRIAIAQRSRVLHLF